MGRMIVRNSSLVELGTIYDVLSCQRTERINSDNVLLFSAILTAELSALITHGNVVEVDGDYFDIVYYNKGQNSSGQMIVSVECEHVSYRLNDPSYNMDYYTQTGSPVAILTEILSGTGFTIDTVDATDSVTYSAQEAKSRRGLLMEFVDVLNGEVVFEKFDISIINRRGSATPISLTASRDIEIIDKTYNGREVDADGNALITHTCSLVRPISIALGDLVTLVYETLDIDTELRIVSITSNPYDKYQTCFEIGNFVPGLADDAYRIETSMVAKGSTYYGARISPEYGFESIRNDKMARTVMNADQFAMQVGDGSGSSWTNKLYFDVATGKYIFDGTLSATMIEALEAEFGVLITQTAITNQLSAQKGTIAELTVDRVDTSDKVQNYLAENTDDVNYLQMEDQFLKFITASVSSGESQVEDRFGNPLYWLDDTFEGTTLNITDFPVMIYNYTELEKMRIEFVEQGGVYIPMIVMGAGTGVGNNGKGFLYKGVDGLELNYLSEIDGSLRQVRLDKDGVTITPANELRRLNFSSSGFTATYVVDSTTYTWEKDGTGRITKLTELTTGIEIPITWS